MNISTNNVFTPENDTRDYAIKLLINHVKRSVTTTDIPTNIQVLRHPKCDKNVWLAINSNKKVMFKINTKDKSITKIPFNTKFN